MSPAQCPPLGGGPGRLSLQTPRCLPGPEERPVLCLGLRSAQHPFQVWVFKKESVESQKRGTLPARRRRERGAQVTPKGARGCLQVAKLPSRQAPSPGKRGWARPVALEVALAPASAGLWAQCSTAWPRPAAHPAPPPGPRRAARCWGPRPEFLPAPTGTWKKSAGHRALPPPAAPRPPPHAAPDPQAWHPRRGAHQHTPPRPRLRAVSPFPEAPGAPSLGGTHRAARHVGARSFPAPG